MISTPTNTDHTKEFIRMGYPVFITLEDLIFFYLRKSKRLPIIRRHLLSSGEKSEVKLLNLKNQVILTDAYLF